MSFKDDVRSDTEDAFFDLDEFAEIHEFNGRKLMACVDVQELVKRERQSGKSLEDGTYRKRFLVFVKQSDMPKPPATNNIVTFDEKKYIVKEAHIEADVVEIVLEVRRS